MKVVIAAGDEKLVEELEHENPGIDFQLATDMEEQKLQIRDADVYYGWPDREVFLAAERLRWVQVTSTGIDRLFARPEMIESDVVLTNCRGPHADPMADHVFAMVLGLAHRMPILLDAQRAHDWKGGIRATPFFDLVGHTMGILSMGDIGRAVARRAVGFGMDVYGVDKYPASPTQGVRDIWGLERLDELLGMSDWFVITSPLTAETRGLIDRRRFGLLKAGAHVIVISRGNIIDEDALIEALRSGRIAGAGLDVTSVEPLPDNSPLWDMDNVLITPHCSAASADIGEARQRIFKENLRRFLAGEPFLYVCDKKAGF